jgi:hypothetical protein
MTATLRCWFDMVDCEPDTAWAAAPATDRDGQTTGWLAVWLRPGKPTRRALLADPRAFDPEGAAASVSMVVMDAAVRVIFDDPAVQRARQLVLADNQYRAVTTLARNESIFGGSVLAVDAASEDVLADDPFQLLARPRILRVGPGLIGCSSALPAPVIERYGGQPWPADRFPEPTK